MSKFSIVTLTLCIIVSRVLSQDYLDSDNRTMKLTEVSTDKTYGYDFKNPIKVGTKEKADGAYLNALKSPTGEKMHIADMNFNYQNKMGLEMVVLSFEGKTETETLYISTVDFETPKCPVGFLFKTIDDIPKVIKLAADSILKVIACDSRIIYSVDDLLLKAKVGSTLTAPHHNPAFTGGVGELKKYFAAHPLSDEKAKQLIFRVHIGFLVTCDGKAGNFIIVSQGHGDMETYANQILAIVNKMPQSWEAATKNNKPVDSYQILSFTVSGGALDKVSYR